MSKPRTIQEINNDYFQTAALLGDLEYKMHKFPDQIDSLREKLKSIDREAELAQKVQAKTEQAKPQETKPEEAQSEVVQ